MNSGKLVVTNNKSLQLQTTSSKGKSVSFSIKDTELSEPLMEKKKNAIAELNGLEVEFDEVNGQPKKVREKGKSFNSSSAGDFHNPYNFVPALPRDEDRFKVSKLAKELGDRSPSGHGSYQDELWSGKISVTLTTVTPLLIPDAANLTVIPLDAANQTEKDNVHKIYDIRLGVDGKPYLPPTSIKGMLRSAYEAVTNSRLSVFEKHDKRLFYRMSAGDGLSLVPARIEGNQIRLLFGTNSDIPIWNVARERWQVPNNLMYAAWLPRYNRDNKKIASYAVKYPDGTLPQHGQRVNAWLEKYRKVDRKGRIIFEYWRVRDIVPFDRPIGEKPSAGQVRGSHEPTGEEMISIDGHVCITNKNIKNKHDERVFFSYQNAAQHEELFSDLSGDWEYLIKDYQENHAGKKQEDNLEWSRHVLGNDNECKLTDETLCYAYVEKVNGKYQVKRLYPVMISRAIFDLPPERLLSANSHAPKDRDLRLKPAEELKDLSPADRVFGWVNQDGKGSYKGQFRISSVKCESDNAVKKFDKEPSSDGLPLAILGEPKPEQVRFYVAENFNGYPLEEGTKKAEGYQEGQGLRGRKVYPHHQLPNDYWNTDSGEIQIGDRFREYLRPDKKQDTQNRTIKSWVEPKTKFSFEIDIINLSTVELGALLWLLQMSENFIDRFHRLGGAKPLGFGSVQLKIEETDLRTGQQWREFYRFLMAVNSNPDQTNAISSIKEFKTAVENAYSDTFEKVSFIAAFFQSAKGFERPIHYPRLSQHPNPDGNSYEWFVDNENDTKTERARRLALPLITQDPGLPLSPRIPKS